MNRLELFAKKIIPREHHDEVKKRYMIFRSLPYLGLRYICPICNGHFRKFLPFGNRNARCPRCESLERHRLLWLYLLKNPEFFTNNLRLFHVAPKYCLWTKFRKLKNFNYITTDISSRTGMIMVKMDITNISFSDNQFDYIICYHVLEHIPNDEKAMKELFRVLKKGGLAILQSAVNQDLEKTFEDPSVTLPEDREVVFGQKDHCRIYGLDYKNKLEKAGFTVKLDDYVRGLDTDIRRKYFLEDEIIYLCTK